MSKVIFCILSFHRIEYFEKKEKEKQNSEKYKKKSILNSSYYLILYINNQ